ncbi:hypothetical protein, partial [Paraburkholderia atlantica]|uniref:hypothetical protein n=1 Tax=Paraburkholderia atlantica TaxID=2654982 RepID=UPI001D120B59
MPCIKRDESRIGDNQKKLRQSIRHHQLRRDILTLFVARLSSRLSRHTIGITRRIAALIFVSCTKERLKMWRWITLSRPSPNRLRRDRLRPPPLTRDRPSRDRPSRDRLRPNCLHLDRLRLNCLRLNCLSLNCLNRDRPRPNCPRLNCRRPNCLSRDRLHPNCLHPNCRR